MDSDYRRLQWHSRRGMLELDLVLEPFINEAYPSLTADDQQRYVKLLACEDQDLFAYFINRVEPEDEELRRIVGLVLAHVRGEA